MKFWAVSNSKPKIFDQFYDSQNVFCLFLLTPITFANTCKKISTKYLFIPNECAFFFCAFRVSSAICKWNWWSYDILFVFDDSLELKWTRKRRNLRSPQIHEEFFSKANAKQALLKNDCEELAKRMKQITFHICESTKSELYCSLPLSHSLTLSLLLQFIRAIFRHVHDRKSNTSAHH